MRDDAGKVVAHATGKADDHKRLALTAASFMTEKKVLLDLGVGDVAQQGFQADFGIPDGEYVADLVSPLRLISHDRGTLFVEDAKDLIRLVLPHAAGEGDVSEITPAYSTSTFVTEEYGLMAKLPRRLLGNADFDLKRRSVIRLCEALKLARENRVATQLLTSTNFASGNRQAVTNKWNGGTAADPLGDLFAALALSYLPANIMVLSERVAQYFYANTGTTGGSDNRVTQYVQGGGRLPRIAYSCQKIFSGGALDYLWAPSTPQPVVLVRNPGDPDRIPTSCTFRWLGQGSSEDEGLCAGMLCRSFFSPQDDAEFVVVVHNDIEVMPTNTVGAILTGALQ